MRALQRHKRQDIENSNNKKATRQTSSGLLDARVVLWERGVRGAAHVGRVGGALVLEDGLAGGVHGVGALGLEQLEGESLGGVPGNVAVDEPRARVVELKGEGEVAVGGQAGDVAARRVDEVELGLVAAVGARRLREDPKVVAVHVDRVVDAEARVVLDDEHDPLRGAARRRLVDRDDVVFQGEAGVAVDDLEQGGVVPLQLEVAAVERPLEPGAARSKVELLKGRARQVGHVQGDVRDEARHGLVAAGLGGGDGRVAGGVCGAAGVVAHDARDAVGVAVGTARADPLRAEPVVVRGGAGLHDDIVPLAHGHGDGVGGVRDDGDEIAADDGQVVPVDRELKVAVRGGVDHAEAVFLASLEDSLKLGTGAIVRVGAVDETVLHGGWAAILG